MEIKSKFGTYKVATGNIYTKVGDIKHNKEEVILLIKEAITKNDGILLNMLLRLFDVSIS